MKFAYIFFAFVAGFAIGAFAFRGENVSSFKTESNVTLQNLVDESKQNYDHARTLMQQYRMLYQNSDRECDIVGEYFGQSAAKNCSNTVFDGVKTNNYMSDVEYEAEFDSNFKIKATTDIDDYLNHPPAPEPEENAPR
ncbi:MAG: hypothetical protein ACM3KH_00615 [Thiobacillus sp.]